jgi:long-chain fatty acid transport protein
LRRADAINPTVGWKVSDVLSAGAGIDFLYGKAVLQKTPFNPSLGGNLYNSSMEGDGTAWGYNLGLLFLPLPDLKLGLAHRSGFDLDLQDGDVEIRNINAATSAAFFGGATSFDTKGNATAPLPATTEIGVAHLWDRLTLEMDASCTWWHTYENLQVEIRDERPPVLVSTESLKDWNDTIAIYLGGEYRVTDPFALRLGWRWDPTPVPAETMGPELPAADRLYYCAGAGYRLGNWTFDLAYMYMDKKDRTVSNLRFEGANPVGFSGKWTGDGHALAFDIGCKF